MTKAYKFIHSDMKSENGNHKWKLGKWYHHDGELELCNSGFHACKTALQSLSYVYGDKWFIVEAKGKMIKDDDKFVCSDMRLVKEIPINKVVKHFALRCAKRSLKYYTKQYPNDNRVSECIRITELYLDGEATLQELEAARRAAWSAGSAGSAAWSAAWSAGSAAWSAAWNAARSAARSARSAESAAWSAAQSAAQSAAWNAAGSAAQRAEKKWQEKELNKIIKKVLGK
jgi:hypothetical protein